MIFRFIQQSSYLKKKYFSNFGTRWVQKKIEPFDKYLIPNKTLLDIGCGSCLVTMMLKKKGLKITPLDVENLSYTDKISPIVYDGVIIPFSNKSFDQSLLLTVLHHTNKPEDVLREAKRVSKQILIIEDIYKNPFQKQLTFLMDQFVNLGYSDCPKTNKDDDGWKKTFEKMNLKLIFTTQKRVLLFFRQAYYIVE